MNILQLSKHMNDSGVNSHIIQLSRMLQLEGHRVIVVSSGGPHTKELRELNIRHHNISFMSKNPFVFIANLFQLFRLIHREKIDIAHTHWRSIGIYLKIVSMFTKVNFVWTNHLNDIPSSWLYRKLTFWGKYVVTVSADMLPMLRKKLGVPSKKLRVVNNGIDSEKYYYYPDEKIEALKERYNVKDENVICLLGRIAPVKGHLFLLDALGDFMKKTDGDFPFKLLIAGDGLAEYKDQIIQKAESYGLMDKIVFTGYADPVDILNISDLMVLPSKNEGFPIVCIEAFALHVPVVRSKVGGYSDMKDYCIGVDYGDINALSESIYNVLTYKSKATEMTDQAYHYYQENLTSQKMASKLIEIYRS